MVTLKEFEKFYSVNIKNKRIEKSMTQEQLAEKIDLTDKYISDLETGRRIGSLETLLKIANALDVEPYELLTSASKTIDMKNQNKKSEYLFIQQLKKDLENATIKIDNLLKSQDI